LTSGDGVPAKLQSSSAQSGWLQDGLLSPVGDLLADTTVKLSSDKPALLILTPEEQ
jgi:hypothetical protein